MTNTKSEPYYKAVHGNHTWEGTLRQLADEFGTTYHTLRTAKYTTKMKTPRSTSRTPFRYAGITIKEIGKIRYRSMYTIENCGTHKTFQRRGTKEEIAAFLGVSPGTVMSHVNNNWTFVRCGRHYRVIKTDEVKQYVYFYDKRKPKIWSETPLVYSYRKRG